MTKKEQMKMQRLEIENSHLRERLAKAMDVYRDQLWELVELRTKLEMVELAIKGGDK